MRALPFFSKRGFTLMELMIVAGILVVAITGLLTVFVSASMLNVANNNKSIAAADAQYVLEHLQSTTYTDLASYTDASFTNLADETIYVTVTSGSGAKNVLVNVTWTERNAPRSFHVYTSIAW